MSTCFQVIALSTTGTKAKQILAKFVSFKDANAYLKGLNSKVGWVYSIETI